MLAQLNDCIGGLLHLGPNVITFRALLHLGPTVITFRTLLHLGQLLHLGLQHLDGTGFLGPRGTVALRVTVSFLLKLWFHFSNLMFFFPKHRFFSTQKPPSFPLTQGFFFKTQVFFPHEDP